MATPKPCGQDHLDGRQEMRFKEPLLKAVIVLGPTHAVAYFTGEYDGRVACPTSY